MNMRQKWIDLTSLFGNWDTFEKILPGFFANIVHWEGLKILFIIEIAEYIYKNKKMLEIIFFNPNNHAAKRGGDFLHLVVGTDLPI